MQTILIIDDEEDLCRLLVIALRKEKFNVICSQTLADARIKLREHPSIVLLDNNLPDGSGLDFLKGHPNAFCKSFVIMISADARPEIRKEAFREGVRVFLQKPFPVSAVKEAIYNLA
jgi:two-component system response regulator PilR (NtrC family)